MASSSTNCSMLRTNASLIGTTAVVDAKRWPLCTRRYPTTAPTVCKCGTYTLRYIRSIASSSSTTWSRSTSATDRATLIPDSGRPRVLRPTELRALMFRASSLQGSIGVHLIIGDCDQRPVFRIHLVGLRQSLVSVVIPTLVSHGRLY